MSETLGSHWHPNSWEHYESIHIPRYENQVELSECLEKINHLPPLVKPDDINALSEKLAATHRCQHFIIQAGDCAENIEDKSQEVVSEKVNILRELAAFVRADSPALLIGRIAGQYAKPRSLSQEFRGGKELPSFCGDLVNSAEYSEEARKPSPNRLLLAYQASKVVLHHIELLNKQVPYLYTSHEALHLPYEAALTRLSMNRWYNLSTHCPWLGMRTALNSPAHLEYFKGLTNPIAVKLGPDMTSENILWLIDQLNPQNLPGKLTLIHRIGCNMISTILPSWIKAVNQKRKNVLWLSDPMHGNTELTKDGIKTRYLYKIMEELTSAFAIHRQHDSFLHGVHLEVTPDPVTECIDNQEIFEKDLLNNYRSYVDPRLNPSQARKVMRLVGSKLF